MSTNTNKSPATTVDRMGGEPVSVRVTWTLAEQQAKSYFLPGDTFKMVVKKESTTSPGTYVNLGVDGAELFCYSGVPMQGAVLHYVDPPTSAIGRYVVIATGVGTEYVNAPVYQTVTGYLPKLNAGIYHIQLQRYNTFSATYEDYGDVVQMWCQEPNRFEDIYSLKQSFAPEAYLTGAQTILEGGV
jgi:hypothetical protein